MSNNIFKPLVGVILTLIFSLTAAAEASAFCGFYVGGANAKLFNEASQVIIAHQGNKTVLTMANDFQGAVKDFALVVPVPVAIKREQVKVTDRAIIKKLDEFSQPRLVEYKDENPCPIVPFEETDFKKSSPLPYCGCDCPTRKNRCPRAMDGSDLSGVTVEDSFKVNEYQILILSAKESDGLETWLRQNDYQIPTGASEVLRPYIKQNMKFFVAKVDLKEFAKSGQKFLQPLQIAYESPKFMLPIRLGMLNAKGDQDLVAYILSPKGQVEITNYRTVKIPTDKEIPEFVQADFGEFYKATFQRSYEQANKKVAFMEYAWNVDNCDPCTTSPPDESELQKAGVFWPNNEERDNIFITRLHVRYSRAKFAEDLVFQETSNQENFQGRYIMNHPFREPATCQAAFSYRKKVADRQRQEAQNLVQLTGWNQASFQQKIQPLAEPPIPRTRLEKPW
jgi:hypothetical protein